MTKQSTRPSRPARALALTAVATLALGACSLGGGDPDPTSAATSVRNEP